MTEYIVDVQFASDFDADNMRYFELDVRSRKEVVRCRDCKYLETYDDAPYLICRKFDHFLDSIEGFCAWGTKRGEI